MNIHQTAIISPEAEIDTGVTIGPYCIIEENAVVSKGVSIGSHSVIGQNTIIGENCRIFPHVSIGLAPQDLSYSGEKTKAIIGKEVTLREFCTIHRGSSKGNGQTIIGDGCYFMNYVHVGHDCTVGNEVIIANGTNLGGHVVIHDKANISSLFLAHQFIEIGELSIISGHTGARKSIPPFVMAEGRPARIMKINTIGLERAGFSKECIKAISEAYKLLRKIPTNEANEEIKEMSKEFPQLLKILEFYQNSKKGVIAFYSAERGTQIDK
ncbi:MAG: acyl-ACP--UDP-N-acetylglucosamine O-acyltransferase [Candidatus Caenarcaniphilales bacterium]|nr:acyl-ACP--UDP-N-acetylglucosamine O-acyltransferase [Candidatus Caenarcaniphilales bacterium]